MLTKDKWVMEDEGWREGGGGRERRGREGEGDEGQGMRLGEGKRTKEEQKRF